MSGKYQAVIKTAVTAPLAQCTQCGAHVTEPICANLQLAVRTRKGDVAPCLSYFLLQPVLYDKGRRKNYSVWDGAYKKPLLLFGKSSPSLAI